MKPIKPIVEFDFFITDLNGNLRGKRLPADALQKVMTEGVKLPRSVIGFDMWGDDVHDNGLVFETGDSDGICLPVSDKLTPVPWLEEPRQQMLAMMWNPDHTPFTADPRQLLKTLVEKFKSRGLTPVMATELEFYLLEAESEAALRPKPPIPESGLGRRLVHTDCYSIEKMDGLSSFFATLREACQQQNIPADTFTSELGPGQFEINLKHVADPLQAADHAILFKRLVKGVSRQHGYAATFMAKPYADKSGNGFHVHCSLLDDQGRNVFDNGTEDGSEMLRWAIGGLIDTMPDCMLMLSPHLNSYRRFMTGAHAPTSASWGYENRTTAVRVPDSPCVARRVEHRVAGADANPYLVLATVLLGIWHGLENEIEPPEPVTGDGYTEIDESRLLPLRWDDATWHFSQSPVLDQYLGEEFMHVYSAAKEQEQRKLAEQISDIEYAAYLGVV